MKINNNDIVKAIETNNDKLVYSYFSEIIDFIINTHFFNVDNIREDLTSEAFLYLYKGLAAFDKNGNAFSFFYTIAFNRMKTYLTKERPNYKFVNIDDLIGI